jgi:uncharacterized membrane protein YdjX (TVP38/TMEM64 family)
MIGEEIISKSGQISRKVLVQIVLFVLAFGLFVAAASWLIGRYFDPTANPFVQSLLAHEDQTLFFYFFYVLVASVIVPIPTLPIDLVLFSLLDPWSIITIRLFGGLAGGSISFFLARRFGKPLLKRWFSAKNYTVIEDLAGHITWKQFFIITMLPIINTEIMAYAGGLSKLRLRYTLGILAVAVFYRLLLVSFVIHLR